MGLEGGTKGSPPEREKTEKVAGRSKRWEGHPIERLPKFFCRVLA